MPHTLKPIVKKNFPLFLGIIGAVFIGFLEGVGVENAITDQVFDQIRDGDIIGVLGYCAIFLVIWLQVRALRRAVEKLNNTIANSFDRGETRFSNIEQRLTLLEHKTQ